MVRKGLTEKMKVKEHIQDTTPTKAMMTTGINLPIDTINLLKMVAARRSTRGGGRVSVSGVIADLVEKYREDLKNELTD